jgi:hypothetical protein
LIPDLDIYRAAKLLIDQHDQEAPIRAAERADDLLEAGDIEGAAIWRAILGAIEELKFSKLCTAKDSECRPVRQGSR